MNRLLFLPHYDYTKWKEAHFPACTQPVQEAIQLEHNLQTKCQ